MLFTVELQNNVGRLALKCDRYLYFGGARGPQRGGLWDAQKGPGEKEKEEREVGQVQQEEGEANLHRVINDFD